MLKCNNVLDIYYDSDCIQFEAATIVRMLIWILYYDIWNAIDIFNLQND